MTENIITQVSQESYAPAPQQAYEEGDNIDYDSTIHLNIRGMNFTITRDELMSLPESILLCLFPNGVFLDENGQVITNLTEEDIVYVNFEPECFQYIIDTFGSAQRDLQEMPAESPQVSGYGRFSQQETGASVLQSKPAIIVLREDLDYYVIPPISGLNAEQIRYIKLQVSEGLTKNKMIFSGLGYDPSLSPSVEQRLGPAEQHLFDMLCSSGFEPTGKWGSRSPEPSKCVISSLSLVRLRPDEPQTPDSPSLDPIPSETSLTSRKSRSRIANLASSASRAASRSLSKNRKSVNSNQTKLLLFWRKPARKCWWSNQTIDIDVSSILPNQKIMTVKVHVRRVWTLELSVIGVQ
ncbi:DEHA2F15994p [Debaryomyces hansenii CBS767]|uniref:DEHA2F15994p n=1 Tax=Debaryomyces hansenii (strain ATCC 36239 / CBS 767 / BCRC 21394 / JCM 1990 / NBRC 0083 / IGC 2968) TaxID=284592 RepID=Q6BL67_DEBHA|nr:DEHA2F15994p [Debaryomyces hansenii CBS767]CAG89430.2 DEHA2F15994p [Debaryomyces hansenii CBS767]|eukprot:XP_461054.2 DEHA2F15994p [Debaryomyces hansenii CBS767]